MECEIEIATVDICGEEEPERRITEETTSKWAKADGGGNRKGLGLTNDEQSEICNVHDTDSPGREERSQCKCDDN